MKIKSLLKFKTVSVTKSGDYYLVVFDDALDTDDEPYFLIQRQFEFPDRGVCHFESHRENLNDHAKPKSVSLTMNTLRLSYGEEPQRIVKINYGLHGTDFQELVSTLKEMIPGLNIEAP